MKTTIGIALLLMPTVVPAFQPPPDELPNLDRRSRSAKAAPARLEASAALQQLSPAVRVDFDPITQSPRWIHRPGGLLTGPVAGDAEKNDAAPADVHAPVKQFISQHRALFGHGAELIDSARVKRSFTNSANRVRSTTWEQHFSGVSVFEALLTAHVTARGELISVSSQFASSAEAREKPAKPTISAETAVALAATNLGENIPGTIKSIGPPAGADQKQIFTVTPLPGEVVAELIWLPISADELRLCWQVTLSRPARNERFLVLIDAANGEPWLRRALTLYLSSATYRVFTNDSPTPFSPGHAALSTNQPPSATRALITTNALDTNASPAGWIGDFDNETRGNNVDAHTDLEGNDSADVPRPQGSPARVFDFAMNLAQSPSTYSAAAVVQLFYWNNWAHDRLYQLGFTEAAGNFQTDNFGRGGFGNDAMQADAQDGSGFNNANIYVPPDGSAPRMQMFLFNWPEPDRDSALDAEIVLHEYVHGLTTRMVGGGNALYAQQSGGLGEGWSDFYALALLSEAADAPHGNFAMGGYSTAQLYGLGENYYFGIRRYPYSTNLSANPLTFKDIDPSQASAHTGVPISPIMVGTYAGGVHAQGEVWCVTLWEVRAQFIAKYGFTVGNERVLRLITDALALTPPNPTFVEARDAILLADFVSDGGDRNEIWAGFAKRGLGAGAVAPPSYTTSGVRESFEVPDGLEVSPKAPLRLRGPVGGPFLPNTLTFVISNSSSTNLSWAVSDAGGWFNFSPLGGVLAPDQSLNVTATPNANALALAQGFYTNTVTFTNQNTGVTPQRTVVLRAGVQNYFTETFAGDHDLEGSTFTFKPDSSSSYYAVCRLTTPTFYSDPATQFLAPTSDNGYFNFTLSQGRTVALYGLRTNAVFISANGFVSLAEPDFSAVVTLSNHFRLPRVAGLYNDWNPEASGAVRFQELSDRLAITWLGVPRNGQGGSNSFQIELFYEGEIRLTYLNIDASDGIVGLSEGLGVPPDFLETDLSAVVCAGSTVDHFNWEPVASPQSVGVPFGVSISARDVFNLNQPNFTGTVALSARRPGVTIFHANFENGLNGFVISNNVRGTPGLWHLSTGRGQQAGHSSVSSLYYGQNESAGGGGDFDAGNTAGHVTSGLIDLRQVSPPVTLSFNHLIKTEGSFYYDAASVLISPNGGGSFLTLASTHGAGLPLSTSTDGAWTNLTFDLSGYVGRQIVLRFQFDTVDSYANLHEGWYIDDVLVTATAGALAISPTNSGTFSGSIWAGNVTVQEPGDRIVLVATDALGHTGASQPISINAANDLSVRLTVTPQHVTVTQNISIVSAVTNSGPASATGVIVTNELPASAAIAQVSSTAGANQIIGTRVITTIGTLTGGSGARITVTAVPSAVGSITATSTVRRAEADAVAANNSAQAVALVGLPVLSATPVSITEGTGGSLLMPITVRLTPASAQTVSVNFATVAGSATAGVDFVPTNGTLNFPPGVTERTIHVSIIGDVIYETNETFSLQITTPTSLVATPTVACTIYNDDPVPVIYGYFASVSEGDAGTNHLQFPLQLVGASAVASDVAYSTAGGSASTGIDFLPVNGTVRFNPGETNKTVLVPVLGDRVNEPDETIFLYLSALGNAAISSESNIWGVIVDDEPPMLVLTNLALLTEACLPTNGVIDPGEMVTVQLTLTNAGFHGTTSTGFVATLLATNGVLSPSAPQVFGSMSNGGPAVSRPFTFTAGANCGSNLTLVLKLQDGTTNLGLATLSLRLGRRTASWAESFDTATPPFLPEGWGEFSALGSVRWGTASSYSDTPPNAAWIPNIYSASLNYLFSPRILIQAPDAQLRFRHFHITENYFDYGTLMLLPDDDGITEWTAAGGTFERGGYNRIPSPGWTGLSGGFITTIANFPTNMTGRTVRLVWAFSTDYSVSGIGWAIDTVELLDGYACCDSTSPFIYSAQRVGADFVLRWSALSNRTYRVETATSLGPSANWTALAGDVLAHGITAGKTNSSIGPGQRFYRVNLLP